MARVLSTKEFDTWERLLPKEYQEQIEVFIRQLKLTWNVGKPLGYPFFREKKMGKYRVYFLIKSQLDYYKEIIRKNI